MQNPFHLRRAGIALAGAALLLAGATGANAFSGPQPGTGLKRPAVADSALANPAMNAGSELQFISVAPCRILDTRVAGGALTATSRVFSAVAPYATQGGLAAGCEIPASAVSLQVNLGAISQAGTEGFVKGWATDTPEPNASLNNYQANQTEANMVTIPLSESDTFTLKTNRSAHLFADVAGYYVKPLYASIDAQNGEEATVWDGVSSGLVDVVRIGEGEYEVTFDRNVTKCVGVATDYWFPVTREISVDTTVPRPDADSIVAVSVKNSSTGAPEDTVFHLSLTC